MEIERITGNRFTSRGRRSTIECLGRRGVPLKDRRSLHRILAVITEIFTPMAQSAYGSGKALARVFGSVWPLLYDRVFHSS